jgi:hypothetical protein
LKLQTYGITGNIHFWIGIFLTCRKQRVVLGGEHSGWVNVKSGVPQGTVVGPLLFLIYLNDLPDNLSSSVRLFADDYRNITTASDASKLQHDLQILDQWQNTWQMSFNAQKCFLLRVTHKQKPIITEYKLGESVLQETKNHSYLGVEITHNMKWNIHVNNITAKANRSLGFIRRNLISCPKDLKERAYITLVRPLLEYSSTVWDSNMLELSKQIESVQRRAARFVMNKYGRDSSPSEMISTLGWETLAQRRKVARVTMMYKISTGQAAIPERTFLQPVTRRSRYHHSKAYHRPQGTKDCWVDSFFPNTIKDWNQLSEEIITSETTKQFKQAVTNHYNSTSQPM